MRVSNRIIPPSECCGVLCRSVGSLDWTHQAGPVTVRTQLRSIAMTPAWSCSVLLHRALCSPCARAGHAYLLALSPERKPAAARARLSIATRSCGRRGVPDSPRTGTCLVTPSICAQLAHRSRCAGRSCAHISYSEPAAAGGRHGTSCLRDQHTY